jgi:hypothetical protein
MKNLAILIFILSSINVHLDAQVSAIFNALSTGNAADLERFMDDRIELVLDNRPSLVSKKQAVNQLSSFFDRVVVRSSKEIHQGSSRGKDSKYTIGQLMTNDGEYRIFLFIRQNGSQSIIQEIRIDRAG